MTAVVPKMIVELLLLQLCVALVLAISRKRRRLGVALAGSSVGGICTLAFDQVLEPLVHAQLWLATRLFDLVGMGHVVRSIGPFMGMYGVYLEISAVGMGIGFVVGWLIAGWRLVKS
jgi:hypothetical protein